MNFGLIIILNSKITVVYYSKNTKNGFIERFYVRYIHIIIFKMLVLLKSHLRCLKSNVFECSL